LYRYQPGAIRFLTFRGAWVEGDGLEGKYHNA